MNDMTRNARKLTSEQPLEEQVADVLTRTIVSEGWTFYAEDKQLRADEVAGPKHMLPVLFWQVEKNMIAAYGASPVDGSSPLGLHFRADAEGQMGVSSVLSTDRARVSRATVLLFALDVIATAIKQYPVYDNAASIDHVIKDFFDDLQAGALPWTDARPHEPDFSLMRNAS